MDGLKRCKDLDVARPVDRSRAKDDDRDGVLRRQHDLLGGQLAAPIGRHRIFLRHGYGLAVDGRTARLQTRDVHEASKFGRAQTRRLDEVRRPADVDREKLVQVSRLDDSCRVDDCIDSRDGRVQELRLIEAGFEELDVG